MKITSKKLQIKKLIQIGNGVKQYGHTQPLSSSPFIKNLLQTPQTF